MKNDNKHVKATGMITWFFVLLNVIVLRAAYVHNNVSYWWLLVSLPLLIVAIIYGKRGRRIL